MGRPSKFKDEFIEQAAKLCKLGATDRELADFFEVSESTLYLWKLENESFSEALKRGKEIADKHVEQSLYRRALGYSHDAVKIFHDKDSGVTTVPYVEHYPPDTVAAIFWLKNRRPTEWRDVKAVEFTKRPLENMGDEDLAEIAERLRSQLATDANSKRISAKSKPKTLN